MEIIIIICLLLIIIFLLLEKKQILNVDKYESKVKYTNILGSAKNIKRQSLPINENQSHSENFADSLHTFTSETTKEAFDEIDVKKDLTEIFVESNNWQEEEEEFSFQNDSNWESGFATGVTFQELDTAEQLLHQELLEPVFQQQAVEIIQKIQGTELFTLLENSLATASSKIALLLQKSEIENELHSLPKNEGAEGFDIGEFV